MINTLIISCGKLLSLLVKSANLGHGSTWPGHIALIINKNFIKGLINKSNIKIVLVAGTNGKTTTAKIISEILTGNKKSIIHNTSGANLLNGIASSLLLQSNFQGKINNDYAIFEVDENALPLVLKEINPHYLIVLNLFRDQLDRYGEVNTIASKWKQSLTNLTTKTKLILNADDPQIAYLGEIVKNKVFYFSCDVNSKNVTGKKGSDAADSNYCPKCSSKLKFKKILFSHLGDWYCSFCKLKRPLNSFKESPHYPLYGLYNKYNTNAAVLFSEAEMIPQEVVKKSLLNFKPAFGRQEILIYRDKKIHILLAKNPTGFNESLRTAKELGATTVLFVLNDRIPDGRDVSWIWDTDLENILEGNERIIISGDRLYDMALRIKYLRINGNKNLNYKVYEKLDDAINKGLELLRNNEILFIIPTYSAMLEVRKIITGKKIQ